jgi:hypothetical protein
LKVGAQTGIGAAGYGVAIMRKVLVSAVTLLVLCTAREAAADQDAIKPADPKPFTLLCRMVTRSSGSAFDAQFFVDQASQAVNGLKASINYDFISFKTKDQIQYIETNRYNGSIHLSANGREYAAGQCDLAEPRKF